MRARGGLESWRDTITTGRVFAVSPKSANQTSPGCGFIEQVEDLLFDSTLTHQIENVMVSEFHNLGNPLSHLSSCFRLPLAQPSVQPLNQRIHNDAPPTLSLALIAGTLRAIYRTIVRSKALTPFQVICTPMQTRMKEDRRMITFIAASPRVRPIRSAKR